MRNPNVPPVNAKSNLPPVETQHVLATCFKEDISSPRHSHWFMAIVTNRHIAKKKKEKHASPWWPLLGNDSVQVGHVDPTDLVNFLDTLVRVELETADDGSSGRVRAACAVLAAVGAPR